MYHKTDVHIGRKVRERRVALGWSQSDLAERLGISFQQVQKYESGANRISGSRIWDIANVLQTPVSTFFEGLDGQGVSTESTAVVEEERTFDRQTLELARAVNRIDDEQVKTQLIRLVKAFAKAA
ncbi:MAG: helix-turn-helix transcriptional regulator [Tistlia sp.]|uniref:helix-turn-helix domain-containing protein n=1 Tax=Tistlia sp. TaxID=3057121 RepID=UPI0034A40FF7